MTTITLLQNASYGADAIILMTARPGNVNLNNLAGQGAVFTCSNPAAPPLAGSTSVEITYDGAHHGLHETIQISSIHA